MACLKTHDYEKITCVMKNQFGCIPDSLKEKYHPYLREVLYFLNKALTPDLCIVDGRIGLQGKGPISGDAVKKDIVIVTRETFFLYMVVMPILMSLILTTVLGTVGTARPTLAVYGEGELASILEEEPSLNVTIFSSEESLREAVLEGEYDGGLLVSPTVGQDRAPERLGLGELCVRHVGLVQICTAQVSIAQIGVAQVSLHEIASRQVCPRQVGTVQIGLAQIGKAEVDVL